jgi:hypothetical protein
MLMFSDSEVIQINHKSHQNMPALRQLLLNKTAKSKWISKPSVATENVHAIP